MTEVIPESQADTAAEDVSAGELFAQRYRLGSMLGRGGSAIVHRAFDERLRRPVALKVFRLDGDCEVSSNVARRFAVEARLLARLHHSGLVEIFEYGQVPEGPYLALELISGPTLGRLVAAGPLSFAETMRIGRAVADTLAYIHSAGVVHRDVKPSNILLDDQGRPRLTDFGVSLAADTASTTQTGNVVGTAAYLAPEQVLGNRADSAADIFALGLVLIECLTGRREYPGLPAASAVARLHRLPAVPQGLPRGVSRMLEQMTEWDPAERPEAWDCAVVFGRPGFVSLVPSTSIPRPELPAISAGVNSETTWVHPAVVLPATGRVVAGRGLSAVLAVLALLALIAAAGVAAIAPAPGDPSRAVQAPGVVANPQPTTTPITRLTTGPSPFPRSPASAPGTQPTSLAGTPPLATQDDSETKTERHKDRSPGNGDGDH